MRYLHLYITLFLFLPLQPLFSQVIADYRSVINNNHITIHVDSNQMKYIFMIKKVKFKPSPKYTYIWYASGNILQNQGSYSGKVLHGDFQAFYANKKLAQQGKFQKGLKKGTWLIWDNDGILKTSDSWDNGIKNGDYSIYSNKGRLLEQGKRLNGNKHGKVIVIDANTDTSLLKYYKNGREISKEDYINQNLWRKSGKFVQDKWKRLFQKNKKNTTENLAPQLFN